MTGEGPARWGASRTPHVCLVRMKTSVGRSNGFTLLEVLITVALAAAVVTISVPMTRDAIDEMRTAAAARHLAERIALARAEAVRRSSAAGLRFIPDGTDYRLSEHADGNDNGLRNADISSGIDPTITHPERLKSKYSGVRFGLIAGIPDLDGAMGSEDGVRIGSSRILSLSPDGTATPGTLYVRGTRSQYAIRVLGATGRTRVFQYDSGTRRWKSR